MFYHLWDGFPTHLDGVERPVDRNGPNVYAGETGDMTRFFADLRIRSLIGQFADESHNHLIINMLNVM